MTSSSPPAPATVLINGSVTTGSPSIGRPGLAVDVADDPDRVGRAVIARQEQGPGDLVQQREQPTPPSWVHDDHGRWHVPRDVNPLDRIGDDAVDALDRERGGAHDALDARCVRQAQNLTIDAGAFEGLQIEFAGMVGDQIVEDHLVVADGRLVDELEGDALLPGNCCQPAR